MKQSDLILSKLAERFPGLADGTEPVNGGDVVAFLGQYQEELAAIAEKGAQSGRRKAAPKRTYWAIGTVSYIDKHVVTDPHVAANKFLKKRRCAPDHIKPEGDTENFIKVVGVCSISQVVILEGDDYGYLKTMDPGEPGDEPLPDLKLVLREAVGDFSLSPGENFVERGVVEGKEKEQEMARQNLSAETHQLYSRILREFGGETGERIIEDLKLSEGEAERAESFWNQLTPDERDTILCSRNGGDNVRSVDISEEEFARLDDLDSDEFIRGLKLERWL